MEAVIVYLSLRIRRQKRLQRRRLLSNLRDKSDPLSIDENLFKKMFRLPKALCRDIIDELNVHDTQASSLPFMFRFLSVLYFLAQGSYQKCISNNYLAPMSQSAVSRNVAYICNLLVGKKSAVIHFPQTTDEKLEQTKKFYEKYTIKGTMGAIDCTHISIICPPINDRNTPGYLYMNRKGYYSINVEAICDQDLNFLYINAKFPGSCHDAGIWTTSSVRAQLKREYNPSHFAWIIGDSGYPLEPWLLTPFSEPSTHKEVKFNHIHAKARNTIERAFGVWKSTFRCLHKHRTLHYSHKQAGLIIYACGILHNILRQHGIDVDDELVPEESEHDSATEDNLLQTSEFFREGRRIRQQYTNSLQ